MQPSEIVPFICLSIISKKFLIKIYAEAQWINDIDQGPKSSNGSHYICGMMLNNGWDGQSNQQVEEICISCQFHDVKLHEAIKFFNQRNDVKW